MKNRLRRSKRGFSLIEILFAVFIVGIAASILVVSMPTATKSRLKADLNNKATSMAQKQLESIRGLGYANISATQLNYYGLIDGTTPIATNTYSFTNSDSTNLDNPARILPSGTGTVRVEQADVDLRRVVVTVNWSDRGTNRSVAVGTLVANL